jgi:iron(III) transport system permease protein
MDLKRPFLLGVVCLLAVAGFLPIVVMFAKSMRVEGEMSFVHYISLFASSRPWNLLKQSLALSFLTTLLATGIGIPLGILFGKSDLPFRRVFTVLFSLPLLLPPYIIAVSWFHVIGREGLLAHILGSRVTEWTSSWLFGLPGCVLVLVTAFMPIVLLLTMTYLKTVHPHLEEAARLVAPWRSVLKRIIIPLIMPGVLLSSILVFILTLGEFSVPMFLRYDVFPVESFTQFSAFYNYEAGTAAAIPLLCIVLLILLIERGFLRDKTYQIRPTPSDGNALIIKLGTVKWRLFVLVGLFCLFNTVLPILVLVIQSGSFSSYLQGLARASDSLARSLLFAAVGASLLTIFGYFTGYLIQTKAFSFWRAVDSMTIFLFALPGTVIGIGLISLWNQPVTNFIYATPAIIILGYLAQYTALTSRMTVSTLVQIPPSMEEAAQVAGAGWMRRVIWIVAPLAKRGLIAGWLVGYIFCLRDTGISMMVYPPGWDTFPVRIFTLMANSPSELVAALCVMMIGATLLPLGLLGLAFRARKSVL